MGETGSDVLFGAVEDFAAERDPTFGSHARLTGWLTFQEQFVPKHRDPQEIAALHTALDEYLATLKRSYDVRLMRAGNILLPESMNDAVVALGELVHKHRVPGPRCDLCRDFAP